MYSKWLVILLSDFKLTSRHWSDLPVNMQIFLLLNYCCYSSTLAWKIPWTEEPGGLQSMGSLRVGHDWATSLSLSCIGEGNGNPLQCSCLENPRDGGAWWAAIYGVAQSQTRLKRLSSSRSSSTSMRRTSKYADWKLSFTDRFKHDTAGKESAYWGRSHERCEFDPCVRKIPWRRKWQSTPVFLPGEFHGQKSLERYSSWGSKESDKTEQLTLTHSLTDSLSLGWGLRCCISDKLPGQVGADGLGTILLSKTLDYIG